MNNFTKVGLLGAGLSTSLAATYEVVDDWGDTWWSGVLNFEANTCTAVELTL